MGGFDVENKICIVCEGPLQLGKFAYNQEMCWECFEQRVISISQMTRDVEDSAIVMYLLDMTRNLYTIRRRF